MYPAQVLPSAGVAGWCPRRDSNPHASRPPALDRRRLPVPSRGLSCWWGASRPPRSGGRGSSRLSARRTADQPSPPVRRFAAGPGRDVAFASALLLLCALLLRCLCLAAVPSSGRWVSGGGIEPSRVPCRGRQVARPSPEMVSRVAAREPWSAPRRLPRGNRTLTAGFGGPRRDPRSGRSSVPRHVVVADAGSSSSPETNRTSSCEIRSLTVGSTAGGMPTRPGWSRARVRSVVRGNRTLVHRSRNGGPVPLDDDHREQCGCTAARPKGFEPS